MHRRPALLAAALCALLAGCASSKVPDRPGSGSAGPGGAVAPWLDGGLVRVEEGLLRGRTDRGGSLVWRGVPYAAPPLGELRWRPPQPPRAWAGIRDAGRFGGWAVQRAPFLGFSVGSEDCLYLNVWRPATEARDLPVYVYIHGGGNTAGASNLIDDYLGWALSTRSDLVVVSLNYRLGPLGWFLDPGIQEEGEGASGNFGLLDIEAALRWVQANIRSFGGDPGRVTVAGESAGALNVLSLLLSPQAKGLFSRAVVESGYDGFTTRDKALAASEELLESLLVKRGRAKDGASAKGLAESLSPGERGALLRGASAKELVALLDDGGFGMTKWPSAILDGKVLPYDGLGAFARGDWPVKVPLIIGSNKEETKLFLSGNRRLDWRSDFYKQSARFGSLQWKAVGVDGIADAIAASPGAPPVYIYRFDWGAPAADGTSPEPGSWGRRLGSFHSIEVSFFLGTGTCLGPLYTGRLFTKENLPGREALSTSIMAYLGAFAATGSPQVPGQAAWPARPRDAEAARREGLPLGLILDAGKTELRIRPLEELVTRASVAAEMARELDPETAAAIAAGFVVR